ncbi:MAG: response regulator [Pseudodesulfovibrio sp.]|uniref:Response regulator receiver n=1 Tax=Pseudodesulfovibrio aespoeensis (strain ATCC 700646 / DSM 10631 / Aspo-2) TaxID=643562 RepID=E6VUJ8_PSEA9|nr:MULTISPECIES: response regulator [Pseudodesulfovibrio]MBU4191042.1 response regulator [Pseudomonadota bacterium]ADU61143.1 response regulator receiver [Pseudodesulfovibrio aespoeensis Aspo-2]MBU4244389.1 response regulator [Pseudomonadota bacterium]MBU4378765.1 response regulator [Pseudomonadota bacterium]MBU4475786.1 response regulator [Pseudomonadota bacterium]
MEDKITVLAVDDEPYFLELFANRFRRRGIEVLTAQNGKDALEILAAHSVDVVVLDVLMPGMDGIETLKEIKKRHPLMEVIMLTGHSSADMGLKGMRHGAYDYVMKPFRIDDLLGRIQRAHERRRLNLTCAGEQA